MTIWTIVAMAGALALPQLLLRQMPSTQLRMWGIPLSLAALAAGLLLGGQEWEPVAFALVLSIAVVTESQRNKAADDFERRERLNLPPLIKRGDPYVRGRFDPTWVIRYNLKAKRQPIEVGEQEEQ